MLRYFRRRLPSTILLNEATDFHPRVEKKNIYISADADGGDTRRATLPLSISFRDKFLGMCDGSRFAIKDGNNRCRHQESLKVPCIYVAMLLLSVDDFLRLHIDNRKRYRIRIEQRVA